MTLVGRNGKPVPPLLVVQPAGISSVGDWAAEVSRKQFLTSIGFAIVHSKVIVIDPNGDNPIVISGSHNFSTTASTKNDENLAIIQNNSALARAYAVNIQSVYDSYEFRALAALMKSQGKNVINSMKDPKSWQAPWYQGDKLQELDFWLPDGSGGASLSAVGSATSPARKEPVPKLAPKKATTEQSAVQKKPSQSKKRTPPAKSAAKKASTTATQAKAAKKKGAAKRTPAKEAAKKWPPAKSAVKKKIAGRKS